MSNVRIAALNCWDLMTLTGDVAPASGFEYTNTQSDDRSEWRSPDATGQYLRGSMASDSFDCNWVVIQGHHLHGGSLRVRGFSNNNWTGTTLFDTSTAAVYTALTTGFAHPYVVNSSLDKHDPKGLESPWWAFFTEAAAVKSVQLDFSSKSTTYGYAYWSAQRIFIGKYMELTINPDYNGFARGIAARDFGNRSRDGSLRRAAGSRNDTIEMNLQGITELESKAWLNFYREAQTSNSVAYSIFPGYGDFQERDYVGIGHFATLNTIGRQVSRLTNRVQIEGL